MEVIKKLGAKQSSDHQQLMAKLNTSEVIKQKVDVLEENYQNLLPLVSKVELLETQFSNISNIVDAQRKESITGQFRHLAVKICS